jgi:hypothetical protein
MLTDTVSTNEPTLDKAEPGEPAQRPKAVRQRLSKRRRLLLTGMIVLLLLSGVGFTARQVYLTTTCAGLISSADYAQAVHLPKGAQMTVQGADRLEDGEPAALVQVRTPQNTLWVWVFGCANHQGHPQLIQLFEQQGLKQGIAEVSEAGTLLTATLDTTPQRSGPFQQYLCQEYAWQQGRFVLRPFPGFYPVTSRLEAEALQQRAHSGSWRDPAATAVQMSRDLLHWTGEVETSLTSQTQSTAQVQLTRENPHVVLNVTLQRLIEPNQAGIWFVTDTNTGGMILTRPGTIDQPFETMVSSPIALGGVSALIDGQTTATLLDHTLTLLGQTTISVADDSTFTATLAYPKLPASEPGVLVIESLPLPENYGTIEPGQIRLTSVLLN